MPDSLGDLGGDIVKKKQKKINNLWDFFWLYPLPNPLICETDANIYTCNYSFWDRLGVLNRIPMLSVIPAAVAEVDAADESDRLVNKNQLLVVGPQ